MLAFPVTNSANLRVEPALSYALYNSRFMLLEPNAILKHEKGRLCWLQPYIF